MNNYTDHTGMVRLLAALDALDADPDAGWVTYYRLTLPDGRGKALVQKRDGCTRTVIV